MAQATTSGVTLSFLALAKNDTHCQTLWLHLSRRTPMTINLYQTDPHVRTQLVPVLTCPCYTRNQPTLGRYPDGSEK